MARTGQQHIELMAIEIERQFLVKNDSWRSSADNGVRIRQGYLCTEPDRIVRVRIKGDNAFLTIKGRPVGAARAEYEYPIPLADAEEIIKRSEGFVIDKTRYNLMFEGRLWEVDIFHGENEGLIMAEVELEAEDAAVIIPGWAGIEITDDHRYDNSNLALTPCSKWPNKK
jgi:adenylate cyclase